jgi:hypothetical protein
LSFDADETRRRAAQSRTFLAVSPNCSAHVVKFNICCVQTTDDRDDTMDPEYTQIAARGEPLTERVANGHTGTLSEPTWDGRRLSGEALAAHVAFEEWPADEPLPEWIDDLQELIDALSPTTDVPEWAADAPFAAVLCQYVDHAWTSFAAAYPTARLTDAGEQSLREILLERLVDVLAQAHHVDFVRFVAEREPELIREDRLSAASTEWHDRYVRAVGRERAAGFFEEYAVAARLLVDTVRQWDDRLGAFCERLHDDWDAATGLVDGAPSTVTGVTARTVRARTRSRGRLRDGAGAGDAGARRARGVRLGRGGDTGVTRLVGERRRLLRAGGGVVGDQLRAPHDGLSLWERDRRPRVAGGDRPGDGVRDDQPGGYGDGPRPAGDDPHPRHRLVGARDGVGATGRDAEGHGGVHRDQ